MMATPDKTPITQSDMADLGKIIADGIAAGIASARPKKLTIGDYNRIHNVGRSKCSRVYSENGLPCQEQVLSNSEIDLLNRLIKPGRYFDRRVEIVFIQDEVGDATAVDIRRSNTRDKALEARAYFKSFEDMLRQIVTIQEAEAAEDALNPPKRKTA